MYLIDDEEDDPISFEMAVKNKHLDCNVSRWVNGEDFTSKLVKNKKPAPILIFLDLKLPAFSDVEVPRRFCTLRFASLFPAFILSGSQLPGAISRAYKVAVTS